MASKTKQDNGKFSPTMASKTKSGIFSSVKKPHISLKSPKKIEFERQVKEYERICKLTEQQREQEYLVKAADAFEKSWEILYTNDGWKLEVGKDLDEGLVYTRSFDKVGKLFKLEAYVEASPAACFDELVHNQEESPTWNPTVMEAKVLQVIDDNVDICYNVATEGAGGLVSSRDFVTLRKFGERNGCLLTTGCAVSHPDAPPTKKHVRGENRPGGWMFKPCPGKPNRCLMVWVINTDLKGWVPQYAVDQALSGVLLTFLKNFRQRMITITRGKGPARRH